MNPVYFGGVAVCPPFEWPVSRFTTEGCRDVIAASGSLYFPNEDAINLSGVPPRANYGKSAKLCTGLRINEDPGAFYDPKMNYFLGLIREYTHQWWITTGQDIFDLGPRFGTRLDITGSITKCVPDISNEHRLPWFPTFSRQTTISIEAPLDQEIWSKIEMRAQSGLPLERATQFSHDAFGSYFGFRDEACILQICIALEIMEIKTRTLKGRPTKDYGDQLLRGSHIWRAEDRYLIKSIFSDRRNIAHGKSPPNLGKNKEVIVEYIKLLERNYRYFL